MRTLIAGLCLVVSAATAQAQIDAKEMLAEARGLAQAGKHSEAIARYQRLATAVEAQLGDRSLALIYVLRELAEQHHALGDVETAEPLYRRSLKIGEENPEAAPAILVPSLRGLGALTAGRGQLGEAESLYGRALTTLEQVGAGDSQDAARTLAELGLLSQLQARVDDSESFYTRALAAGEASELPDAELATIVNNLGALCAGQGRAAEAEPLYLRALAMRERAFGADHREVAFVTYELASLYDGQGRLAEATPLYERTLRIREASGEKGLSLSDLLNQLAVIYRRQNRSEEAETFFRRTARVAEEHLGPDHPMVALRLNNLAVLYSDHGRYQEAEPLYRRVLDIQEKTFGPNHASIAVALVNLASLHHKQGRGEEARVELERAETILEGQCGTGGETGDADRQAGDSGFCRSALEIHRELKGRLAEATAEESAPAPATAVAVSIPSDDGPAGRAPASTGPAAAPERIYRAQVLARRDRESAEKDLEQLRQSHPLVAGLRFRITRADLGDKGVWYRVQLGEFPTGAQAQALCSELTRQGHEGCFVLATAAP